MQQNKFSEYYNIDFENQIIINDLIYLMEVTFPMYNLSIKYNQDIYEKTYDINTDIFYVWMTIEDLKEDDIYYFEDIKLRAVLYISNQCDFDKNNITKLLHEMSKKLHSKIYISMNDIEESICSFSYCSVWCIDNDKRKIMFDAQEFFDDSQNQYCDYLPVLS